MNILIVESENDQYFIESLAKKISAENKVFHIDRYEHCSLDETKLTTKIKNVLLDKAREISKIGIILDMDNDNKTSRIALINKCLDSILKENDIVQETLLTDIKKFVTIPIDDSLERKVACFFTNIDGEGELETVLKAIKSDNYNSIFADCLYDGWQTCLKQKGIKIVGKGEAGDISDKELLKLWVDFYKRFDTLKKGDRNAETADSKGIWLGVTSKGKPLEKARGEEIFNLQSEKLADLRSFLEMFD